MSNVINKKTALVTGTASGIGRVAAEKLLCNGYCVFGFDRKTETGSDFPNFVCDVSDLDELVNARNWIEEQADHLDVLVNAAGVFQVGKRNKIESMDLSEWEAMLKNNLTSVMLMTNVFLPLLKNSGQAAIVNVISDQVFYPRTRNAAYSASKAGILNFTRACAAEFLEYGIRVNAIAPASVRTEFINNVFPEADKRDQVFREQDKTMPLGLILPEEVADVILFFANQVNGKITGQVLMMDSGLYL